MDSYLNDESIKKIDFVIHGLLSGRFDETIKKVEFHEKLAGMHVPESFVRDLLHDIEHLEQENARLNARLSVLEQDLKNLQYQNKESLKVIAKGLGYAIEPTPLTNSSDLNDISYWIDRVRSS